MTKKLKPIQKELLRLFKEIVPLLDKNNIDYFACGGTMIGAVREKGFIPWDDDIDLFMARPDYNKLLEIARKNNNKLGEHFEIACGELGNSLLPFCKIFDKRYKLNAKGVEGDEDYLFIDIFPFDGIPEDDEECKEYFRTIENKRKSVSVARLTLSGLWDVTNNKLLYAPKVVLKAVTALKGNRKVLKSYLDLCKKYSFKDSKYFWSNTWGSTPSWKIEKSDMKTVLFDFEDTKIKVMKGYDKYLTAVFGDYMTPPETKERESHDIEIIESKD